MIQKLCLRFQQLKNKKKIINLLIFRKNREQTRKRGTVDFAQITHKLFNSKHKSEKKWTFQHCVNLNTF